MLGVLVGGFATMGAAALGWISYGHLLMFLGLEILTSLWFTRLRIRESYGPVTNKHAKPHTYVVKVDGREVERHFRPVLGKPLTTQERHWLANNNTVVLAGGGGMAIIWALFADPAFFTPVKLLTLALLTGFMVADEVRFHAEWTRLGLGRTTDPTLQDHDQYWRLVVFVLLAAPLAFLQSVPTFQTYALAVVLLGTDLFLHGRREKWAGFTDDPPAPDSSLSRAPR